MPLSRTPTIPAARDRWPGEDGGDAGEPFAAAEGDALARIFFGNADYFRQSVLGLVDEHVPSPHALVLVCDAVSDIDLTGLDALRNQVEDIQRAGIEVRMCRVKGPVHDALLESGLVDLVGAQHFYDSVRAAKKGQAPDGLPVVPEAGTTAAGPAP